MIVPKLRTKITEAETDTIITRARERVRKLVEELREAEFTLEAMEKATKPLSQKKLAQLEAARDKRDAESEN